jgi:copper resistance protein D
LFTLEATLAAISYLVLALLVGSLVTNAFLLTSAEPPAMRRRLARIALTLAGAFVLVHFAALVVQGAKLSGGNLPSSDLLSRYVLRTQSGQIWLLRALYSVFLLLLIVRLVRRNTNTLALLLLSLPLVASRSLSGHAVAVRENTVLVVAADSLHLIATACWAGTLPFLLYLLISAFNSAKQYPDLAATAVKQFSRLAFLSVAVLLATGVYQAWTHVGRLDALFSTTYGNILVLKLIIFACMLVLGAVNFFFTKPMLLRATASLPQRFPNIALRRVGSEGVLGILILVVSGFLTGLSPAAHSDHAKRVAVSGESPGPHIHRDYGNSSPTSGTRFKPADGAKVKIISPKPAQTYKDDQVPIHFKLTKGKRGHHVHAYVDNELMGMFQSEKGTLTGIVPGNHVLKLRVVAADHTTELDASDEVEFTVSRPKERGQ